MEVKIISEKDFDEMIRITQAAYAGSFNGSPDEAERFKKIISEMIENDPILPLGVYEDEQLLGSVLHYNFETNFHGTLIKTAGIGMLAVDLLHKKKGVAKLLLLNSIERSKEAGVTLYYLYPFSTQFYRNFGFGYGVPVYTYCAAPKDFKHTGLKSLLSYGSEADYEALHQLYDEKARTTHGMSLRLNSDKARFKRYQGKKLLVARENNQITGYMFYQQKGLSEANNQSQKLKVTDYVTTTPKSMLAFVDFFHGQKDQIDYVEIATFNRNFHQFLENTHFVPQPKTLDIISLKAADVGLGLMPLSLNHQALLDRVKDRSNYKLKFIINEKDGSQSSVQTHEEVDVEIKCSINSYSSWITGMISLKELYETGQLETTKHQLLKQIDLEMAFDSPESYTRF